jgi:PAS domain S-box-containing protein
MKKSLNVLIAEDSQDDADLVVHELRRAGFEPKWTRVDTEPDFLAELEKLPDIILSDYAMPKFSGLRAAELLQERGLNIPFMLISGTVGEDVAVEAMKHGVTDYFLKDRIARLGVGVKRALERKLARDERDRAQISLNLFRTLVDRSSDGIEVIDPETGRFLDVNETTCQRLGYQREELLSMCVADIDAGTMGADLSAWRSSVEITRQSGCRLLETRHKRKDGSTFPVEVSVRYVKLDRDYLIASVRDITEHKLAEQKILEYTKELERSNSELQQFAYVASHDLQEPLRAVVGCIQMLDERNAGALDERSRELMGHIVEGAKRMQTLISDLLAYSRVGSKGISRIHIDAREMVNKARRQLSVAIAESNAIIHVDSLPLMWADPSQITQLFQNLIGNAIKFRGTIQPEIHISAEQVDGETIFSVRDNGIGIAPEYHKKIFGIFQRLLSRRDYPGTGIGLAICKKIVERHDGRIWVESIAGEGANFRFTLSESPCQSASSGNVTTVNQNVSIDRITAEKLPKSTGFVT